MPSQVLSRATRSVPALFAGALATAVAAQWSVPIPGSPVPQSLQTLAVVVVGGVLGAGRGGAAMLLYMGMGAAGLPVFADGASGLARLWGPTSGYLLGFVAGAVVVGWWSERNRTWPSWKRALVGWSAGMVLAHLLILTLGWARLAVLVGPGDAWSQGVAPFLWGGVVKSVAGAATLVVWGRLRPASGSEDTDRTEAPEPVEPGTPPV